MAKRPRQTAASASTAKPGRRRVALIVETSIHYGREVLHGITRYIRSHEAWSVFLEQRELWTAPPQWLERWRGDGVICRKTTPELLERFCDLKVESVWTGPGALSWDNEQAQIARWVQSLPRPVGVMACNDMRGQHLLDACQRLDLAVPEETAVIGVDDDAVLCNLCHPPLSSVIPNAQRVGFEAAALLDRLMSGEAAPAAALELPPIGVATRQSSDVLAIDDPGVAGVLRYIREHALAGCSMKDVVKHAGMSRSVLERKFRQYLGHSPQQEIRCVQLKRVKQLLSESDLPLSQIARLAGYEHPEYMNVVFKRDVGVTPGQWRRELGK